MRRLKFYTRRGGAIGTRFQIHRYKKRQYMRYYYKGRRYK